MQSNWPLCCAFTLPPDLCCFEVRTPPLCNNRIFWKLRAVSWGCLEEELQAVYWTSLPLWALWATPGDPSRFLSNMPASSLSGHVVQLIFSSLLSSVLRIVYLQLRHRVCVFFLYPLITRLGAGLLPPFGGRVSVKFSFSLVLRNCTCSQANNSCSGSAGSFMGERAQFRKEYKNMGGSPLETWGLEP